MGQITRTNFGITEVFNLTNAQILTLNSFPVTLVPAIPGAVIVPLSVSHVISDPFVVYTFAAGSLVSWYVGDFATGLGESLNINLAATNNREVGYTVSTASGANRSVSVAQPLKLICAADPTGGGDPANFITVQVSYIVVRV